MYVFVYEPLILWYICKKTRTHYVAHTSGHEGTNLGLKENASAIKPTMDMNTAAKAINVQQDIKALELNELVERDFKKKAKNFSTLPTARYTQPHSQKD